MMSNLTQYRIPLYGAACSALLLGCHGQDAAFNANVQGTVTIDGELAPGGTVTFIPVDDGPTGVGVIASDGSYSVRIGQGQPGNPDGSLIPAGKYIVTAMIVGTTQSDPERSAIGPPPAGPRLIADKYNVRETTDLACDVKEGPNVIVLKLDGPWANSPAAEGESDDAESAEEEAASSDAETGQQSDDPQPAGNVREGASADAKAPSTDAEPASSPDEAKEATE